MNNPQIVFCTTCKDRTQHLKFTLPKNLEDNKNYDNCKFIVLDYNSQDDFSTYILSKHKADIASGRLIIYSLLPGENGPRPFHMAHAKNMAHRLGIMESADILVNLDADNYTGIDFAKYIAAQMQEDAFLWAKMAPGRLSRGISGRIVVTAKAFLKAGGYDEKYDTWAPDDKDFNARLWRLEYIGREINEKYLNAVPHNDKMRFREYKHAMSDTGEDQFDISVSETAIANFGNIGTGIVFKNFDFSNPIEIVNIPTRIFGIGFHKTATSSLHRALTILGYDSAHWKNAHWAKAIWTEMLDIGQSITLERSYALCDLPITILYKQLDLAYPGSKFILTIRDENEWLESIRKHWTQNTNKFRYAWDKDPFSHFIHKEIYGRRDFDAETFLARYKRHTIEVVEYFKSRPSDLLVFYSDGWTNLCEFLNKSIPNTLYPVIK
jgi:hypothetical protein